MRAMPTKPTPDQVCGACRKYEPSRTDAKYGYCKPREQLEQEKRNRAAGRLVDVTAPCCMVTYDGVTQKPAFEAKGGAA